MDVMEIQGPCWLNSKNKDYFYNSQGAASAQGAQGKKWRKRERRRGLSCEQGVSTSEKLGFSNRGSGCFIQISSLLTLSLYLPVLIGPVPAHVGMKDEGKVSK